MDMTYNALKRAMSTEAPVSLPLDPKTMKNEGFQPPIYGL